MLSLRSNKRLHRSGFTLLEVLLVVAIIAILAGIVILAINPGKQLGNTNDARRAADVNSIISAVYQYAIDHGGVLPEQIGGGEIENVAKILGNANGSCSSDCDAISTDSDCLDLSGTLTPRYLTDIPIAPDDGADGDKTGYYIRLVSGDRIEVGACHPEEVDEISVER